MLRLAVSLCNLLFHCYFMFKSWFRIVSFNISDLYLPDLECSETLMWLTAELLLSIILSYNLNNCHKSEPKDCDGVMCSQCKIIYFLLCFTKYYTIFMLHKMRITDKKPTHCPHQRSAESGRSKIIQMHKSVGRSRLERPKQTWYYMV